ncbi:MAG: hypothetical protein O7C59_01260 [Rickettsia endosymbiont of Ixodes persulcatus]|nr:hypothetical protein [Rickettsia endosymbiont of Ixodes persulcatus]
MDKPFIRKLSKHASSEIFGLPCLEIDILPGTITLIDPDVYSLDHITLLRIIASSNQSHLVMVADTPVDLFESKESDMVIAWRYQKVMPKPLLNLNRCLAFKNDNFETIKLKFNSVITIFSSVDSYELKKICRLNNNTAFVTAPGMPYLHFDTVLKIKSLLFENLDYHGLIEIKKSRGFKTLRVEKMKSRVYGFKIKKNGVLIEDITIPPEDEPFR